MNECELLEAIYERFESMEELKRAIELKEQKLKSKKTTH